MRREDVTKFRIQKLLEEHAKYKFPEFLKALRRMHGMRRQSVSDDIGIKKNRLFYLENGRFKRKLGNDEVRSLSDFYGVEYVMLKKKCDDFIKSGLARPQGQKEEIEL